MTSFALAPWQRVADQARVLLHRAERDAGSSVDRAPALAGIERGDQLLEVDGADGYRPRRLPFEDQLRPRLYAVRGDSNAPAAAAAPAAGMQRLTTATAAWCAAAFL